MSRQGSLGKLTLAVLADIGGFQKSLSKAEQSLGDFARKAAVGFKAVAAAGLALVGTYTVLARSAINAADAANKAAQGAGVSGEAFQELQYAADLAGVSTEQLEQGFKNLSKNMVEAGNSTSASANAFKTLGVEVRDAQGNLRESDKVLTDVAAALAKYEDGAAKTAIATDLFGRAGQKLIPLLNSGADGIEALRQEARDLGLVMDDETRVAAEKFNDSLTTLNAVKQGMINRTLPALLPLMNELTGFMIGLGKEAGKSGADLSTKLVGGVRAVAAAATVGSGAIQILVKSIGALMAIGALDVLDIGQIPGILRELKADIAGIQDTASTRIGDIISGEFGAAGAAANALSENVSDAAKSTLDYSAAVDTVVPATRRVRDTVGDAIKALRFQVETLGMSAEETERYRLQLEGATGAQLSAVTMLQSMIGAYEAEQEAIRLSTEEREKAQEALIAEDERLDALKERHESYITGVTGETIRYRGVVQELVELLNTGRINQDQFNDALGRAQTDLLPKAQEELGIYAELAADAAKNAQSAFAQFLFNPFEGGIRGMVQGFTDALRKMVAEALASQIFTTLLKGPEGGLLGGLFGGFRAAGGPVESGKGYVVGEQGPEYFQPSTSGTIVPNHAMPSGGGMQMSQRIINVLDPGMVGDFLASPAGEKVLVNTIRRNSDAVRRASNA